MVYGYMASLDDKALPNKINSFKMTPIGKE